MGARLFRLLLRLLPAEFRDGYARDAEATFTAEAQDARRSGRPGAMWSLWLATAADVMRAAPREHLDILWRDARVALRGMRSHPAHTLTAVFTVALGIGASVTMFAAIDGVLLAPLSYHDAGRLVFVGESSAEGDGDSTGYLSFVDLKTHARSLSHLVAATQSTATFTGDGRDAERVNAMRVSADYFPMVGVAPAMGRWFTAAEDQPGAARRVAILSDALWRQRFQADPGIIGRVVDLSAQPFTIVGVMPATFDDLVASRIYGDAALWVPLGYDPAASFACRTCRHLTLIGRLADGVSPTAAEEDLSAIYRGMATEHPRDYSNPRAHVQTLENRFLGPVRPALLLLGGGVALLFLVACANVASLLLLRASERTGEVAVRAALGVTRARLARQLLTEAVLLSSVGAVVGLVPAWAAVRVLATRGPAELPRLTTLALDGRAVGVAMLLTLGSAIIFGLAPLRQLWRRESSDDLRGAGQRSGSVATWRTRATIVAANVAMAAVLLATSAVLTRSILRLLAVESGVHTTNVLTMTLWAGGERFREGDTARQVRTAAGFYDDILARVRALPGVEAAAATTVLPLSADVDRIGMHIVGRLTANPADAPAADRFAVTGDYFRTLDVPILRGRLLGSGDGAGAVPVAVVNRHAAETLFGGDDPLGMQVILGGPGGQPRTIVGVVGNVRHHGLDRPVGPQVYVPQAQWAWPETRMTLVVRTAGPPMALATAVRAVVRDLDAAQPVTNIQAFDNVVAGSTASRRFVAGALGAFAGAALLLAAVGLYGALSVSVAQRRLEIGIRLALGAHASTIRRMIFANGMRPVVAGLALGLAAGLMALRLLAGMLFEVRPADPLALASAAVALVAAGAIACALPAWRASRIDTARSLRAE